MELIDSREEQTYFIYDGIKAFKFCYNKFVTVDGRVFSLRKATHPKEVCVKGSTKNKYVSLRYAVEPYGTLIHTSVHQVVARAFIDNPNNYEIVDHINENKSDNRVENLRWTTMRGNNDFYNFKDNREIEKLRTLNNELKRKLKENKIIENTLRLEKEKIEKAHRVLTIKLSKLTKEAIKSIDIHAKRNIPADKFDKIVQAVKGDVLGSFENMIDKVSKEVKVNGVSYRSIREASKFIIGHPECTSTLDTVRKEIRKLVRGERAPWLYLNKFYISL